MAFKFTEEQLNTLDKSFIVNLFLQLQDQNDKLSGEIQELNKKMEALQAEALRRAKEMLVLREIMAAQTIPVTPEELEAEAAAIARRQNTTVAELKRFLGEDLAMLQSDLKKRKAADWVCEQMAAAK